MKRLTVLAVVFLLAFMVSSGAHATGFAFLYQRTNTVMESNPVISVMANTFGEDNQLVDVWSISQPNLQDVCYGNRFQIVLAASAKSIVGNDRKADEFIRKYGIRTEWYRPADIGGVPYRYDKSAQADEFNRNHRIAQSDPTDGDSPAKVNFFPAEALNWNTYVQGANVKTTWLRIINGSRLAKELEALGFIRFTTVSHDDVWLPIQVTFVAKPPMEKLEAKSEERHDEHARKGVDEVNGMGSTISNHETRLGQLEGVVSAHADSIDGLAKGQEAIAAQVNENSATIATIGPRVEAIEGWIKTAVAQSQSQPAPAVTPTSVGYTVVFVRSDRTDCWYADSVSEVEGAIGADVFMGYFHFERNCWIYNQHCPARLNGVLPFTAEPCGERMLQVSLRHPGATPASFAGWQARTYTISATTQVVVVPVN